MCRCGECFGCTAGMDLDTIVTLPSGTELSIEAALGDLWRVQTLLLRHEPWGDEGLAADVSHIAELLCLLGTAAPARDDNLPLPPIGTFPGD